MAREYQEGFDRVTSRQADPAGAAAPGKATLVDTEEVGELIAQRVGQEPDEDAGGPDVPARSTRTQSPTENGWLRSNIATVLPAWM